MADPARQAKADGKKWQTLESGRFLLEIDQIQVGSFSEVSGLGMRLTTETIEEGGNNQYVHQLPGRITWDNLVLRRGFVTSTAFFDWIAEASGDGFAAKANKLTRKTGAITALDEAGVRVVRWDIIDAFPVRWSGPSFNSGEARPVAEELEIAHHGLKMAPV